MTIITTDAADCDDVDIAIVAESTYPFLLGGVSAVIQDIIQANPDRTFGIIHITWDSSSDTTVRYAMPDNVKWVQLVYQSMQDHKADFLDLRPADLRMRSRKRRALARRVLDALADAREGDFGALWELYDAGLNPRTRAFPLAAVLGTQEFMHEAQGRLSGLGLSYTDLFWQLREFMSLATAVGATSYPAARVYHAHTTGYAGLVAAIAARQNTGKVVLTEHNLYTRDTINCALDRSMATKITASDYLVADVTAQQRAWMAWFTEMGRMTYPACDVITYLYPEAIDEARQLGGRPEVSRVLPNGMTMAKFDAAFERLIARQAAAPVEEPGYVWQLAFIARLVPIKGLLDLLDSLAILVDRGVTDFHVQIMGPGDHTPEYAAACYARSAELGLDDVVSFVGPQKVAEVIDSVDVLLLPSHNEGQPMSVLEAMTVGIPVIGTDVGGMRQVVVDPLPGEDGDLGPCGALVQPHDVVGFADALQHLLADPGLYRRMQASARARVSSTFQLESAMENYRRLFAELLDDHDAMAAPRSNELVIDLRDSADGQDSRSASMAALRRALEDDHEGFRRGLELEIDMETELIALENALGR